MSVAFRRVLIWGTLAALLAAALAYALRPKPVPVDLGQARVAPLRVTVGDEGEARVRDVYTLYAPLGGRLLRIGAEVGDTVEAGVTELARIEPPPPAFLDARTEAEKKAELEAAAAQRDLAKAELARAEAELAFAASDLARAKRLAPRETISKRALDEAERAQQVARANLATARAALEMRAHELERARSQLLSQRDVAALGADCDCVPVMAPVGGTVLKVLRKSAGVIEAGAPLVEIGDPRDLEIVVDLLSEDAVGLHAGQKAYIAGWGGPELSAAIRRIEPTGRTKVSALGIEEQRVDVVLDLTEPPQRWARLGHGYRVVVEVVRFEGEVLQVPLGALFRKDDGADGGQGNGEAGGQGEGKGEAKDGDGGEGGWAVFRAVDGRARLTTVETGARNGLAVEIKSGLDAGARVVLYPADRVQDGTAIEER
jgi:HlyD family secretion protein